MFDDEVSSPGLGELPLRSFVDRGNHISPAEFATIVEVLSVSELLHVVTKGVEYADAMLARRSVSVETALEGHSKQIGVLTQAVLLEAGRESFFSVPVIVFWKIFVELILPSGLHYVFHGGLAHYFGIGLITLLVDG